MFIFYKLNSREKYPFGKQSNNFNVKFNATGMSVQINQISEMKWPKSEKIK